MQTTKFATIIFGLHKQTLFVLVNNTPLDMQIKLQTELGGGYVYIRRSRMSVHKHSGTAVLNRIKA